MKKSMLFGIITVTCFALMGITALRAQSPAVWVSAYYAAWMQGNANDGYLPAEKIDYSAITHVMHFALAPKSDGTVDPWTPMINQTNSTALITQAHAAGKKVLITVGGSGSQGAFEGAASNGNRAAFVGNLVSFMQSRGYDGIDIDWEPMGGGDATLFQALATDLRKALDAIAPRPLMTAALLLDPSPIAPVQSLFDQINIMTYDLSGAWQGWVTWHNAGLMTSGATFPNSTQPLPSIQNVSGNFKSGGIGAEKIGVGIDFYGYVWSGGDGTPTGGVTAPQQGWSTCPTVQANVPYSTIMKTYYQQSYYRWDDVAQTSYLSIDNPGSVNDKFVSYDDEQTCRQKINYVRNNGLGGVIIWELGGGYIAGSATPDNLLQAIKQALLTPPPPMTPVLSSVTNNAAGVSLLATLVWGAVTGATSYRLQIGTDPRMVFNTIDNAHLTGASYLPGAPLKPGTKYYWRVCANNAAGSSTWSSVWTFTTGNGATLSVDDSSHNDPRERKLRQNYPNPFNPTTMIGYEVPFNGHVVMEVYNMLGQRVSTLVDREQQKGEHQAQFDAGALASGTYIYRVTMSPHDGEQSPVTLTKRMQLVR